MQNIEERISLNFNSANTITIFLSVFLLVALPPSNDGWHAYSSWWLQQHLLEHNSIVQPFQILSGRSCVITFYCLSVVYTNCKAGTWIQDVLDALTYLLSSPRHWMVLSSSFSWETRICVMVWRCGWWWHDKYWNHIQIVFNVWNLIRLFGYKKSVRYLQCFRNLFKILQVLW